MKWFTIILCTLLSTVAIAQDPKSEQMIKHRRAAFTLMSSYFSRILNVVDGEVDYDKSNVVQNAKTVEMLSKLPWIGFAPGTEFGDTRAKPEIWLEEDEFEKLAVDMQNKVRALRVTAETGDAGQVKVAFVTARKSCGACHDHYRKKIE
jgi:cytochrome c556